VDVGNGNGAGPRPRGEGRPVGALVASVIEGVRTLARQRVELAKLEVAEAASVRVQGAGMFAGAAAVALYAIGFIAAAGAAGLAVVLPVWAAILIVGVLLLAVAGILVMIGRRAMKTAAPPGQRTRETLKEDARWAKQQIGS
jgi:uncharacterized membrane protein